MAYKRVEVNVVLTDEQKAYIDANWNKLKFVDLVKGTFQDPHLDGRCAESRVIRDYLGDREPVPTAYQKKEKLELTEEQQEYIKNNAPTGATATEMARAIFKNNRLGPLTQEARVVFSYIKSLPAEMKPAAASDEICEEYKPVNTLKQVVDKVNAVIFKDFDYDTLNAQQKKHFECLRGFMRAPRFLQMINSYSSKISRDIFESEYIRTVYDKPDLTPDELNLCINLCSNYVLMITVNRHLDLLNEKYERLFDDPDAKTPQALAEMIKAKTEELNKCDVRQQKLIDDLQGKRGERLKKKVEANLSVATLIEWWKDERERKDAIKVAEHRRQEVANEVERVIDMSDVKAKILGFTKSELIDS